MTGDASARQYERLTSTNAQSVILMNAPPETCGSQKRFVEIAEHLRALGLAAPQILDWDETLGLMILEDLGGTDFAMHLSQHPDEELASYEAAIEALKTIAENPPPAGLQHMTPDVGVEMIDLAFEWAAPNTSAELATNIHDELRILLSFVSPNPQTLSLRDFHAENLIWRPKHTGNARVGLLDFQDAFVTHPAYDLASLLRDARRDVSPTVTEIILNRLDPDTRTAFHVMAVQRNLRILGIFERLAQRDGKTGYRRLVPRVLGHLDADLSAPDLYRLAPLVRQAFNLNGAQA